MSQKTVVTLIDDLDESEASETVLFGLDSVEYAIDLNDEHAGDLRAALAVYVAAARRTSGSPDLHSLSPPRVSVVEHRLFDGGPSAQPRDP